VSSSSHQHSTVPRWRHLLAGAVLALGLCGCANFWDEITSRDCDWSHLFRDPNPLEVLANSSDGAKRGRALGQLQEPMQNGGTREQQETYINLLTAAATQDREPLCRLGAIRALGNCKDPRAVKILEDAYLQRPAFTGELNTIIRQQALASLEQTGQPEARRLLIQVARSPSSALESPLTDRQQTLDERLAALRALGKYPQSDSIETLVHVLESEKDVALRARAHESLVQVTGKNLPADARAWRDLQANPGVARQEQGFIQRVTGWK
jgi:HEAT repeat protein